MSIMGMKLVGDGGGEYPDPPATAIDDIPAPHLLAIGIHIDAASEHSGKLIGIVPELMHVGYLELEPLDCPDHDDQLLLPQEGGGVQ